MLEMAHSEEGKHLLTHNTAESGKECTKANPQKVEENFTTPHVLPIASIPESAVETSLSSNL